ncbi:alpha/beta hydrolase family protein [Actinocrispum wychmicini]|uniref:Secreted protein n=1 Tax=Actinocrispum wychmicini TaxID=1213861 RepID=A0A4R2JXJ5_9PSEU|nr:hypothetical protein [Actinocrispum wychmicini]TCO65263.1 hypothetical protein EV192_1011051 [Actinocrispum wychmicini]
MRKILITMLAAALTLGTAATASAGPPAAGGQLVWTAPEPVPFGDAAIEFRSTGQFLGWPRPAKDHRTFTLPVGHAVEPGTLEVWAGGRRLDAPPKQSLQKQSTGPLPSPLPVNAVDPGTPGPYQTVTGEYALDPITLPDLGGPIEMQGVVVAPKNAPGPRPLVLFLHGRHLYCYNPANPNVTVFDWPCPAGTAMIPSYRGYLQTQELLASQGYVTVSISADGVNALDFNAFDGGAQARSSLVRQHLAHWADWAEAGRASAPAAVRQAPVADMSNVLLVGHSRGGEGVNRAAMDSLFRPPGDTSPVRWTIRGDVLIAPTAFGQDPEPDVPSVTLLPACDGDVSDLQGQQYADAARGVSRGTALHSVLYVNGANHNFFNSEWTPGVAVAPSVDDFHSFDPNPDPLCSPGTPTRLTDSQQRAVGATYTAAAARLLLARDDRVLPLLDGSGVRAPSAGPARVLSHALGAGRIPVVVPDDSTKVTGSGRLCAQVAPSDACLGADLRFKSPNFLPFTAATTESGRDAVDVKWSAPGTPAVVRPSRPVWLFGARALAMRVIVPVNSAGTRFAVAVTDNFGRRTNLGAVTIDGLAATNNTTGYWAQEVRVPVSPFLGQVASLELTPLTGSGEAWLVDAYGWYPGLPVTRPASLTRVDLGVLAVLEGDSGERTYQIPVTVTGDGGGTLKVYLGDKTVRVFTEHDITVAPGQHTIDLPATVVGDTRWNTSYPLVALAKATRGVVVGSFIGVVRVDNDDPPPAITVSPANAETSRGGKLAWHVGLSTDVDADVDWIVTPVAPATGPELTTTDVDPQWLLLNSGEDPLPSRPLSQTGLALFVDIPPGSVSTDVAIPTAAGHEPGPARQLHLHGTPPGQPGAYPDLDLTGTVT